MERFPLSYKDNFIFLQAECKGASDKCKPDMAANIFCDLEESGIMPQKFTFEYMKLESGTLHSTASVWGLTHGCCEHFI